MRKQGVTKHRCVCNLYGYKCAYATNFLNLCTGIMSTPEF